MKDEDLYWPASNFLTSVANDEVVIDESEFGKANLRLLIQLTRDADRSNRDWATMLLGQLGPATDEVRQALLRAADDEDEYVRAEAISQLVDRDRQAALKLVTRELSRDSASYAIFEAAAKLADETLGPLLEPFAKPSGEAHLDSVFEDALAACRSSKRRSSTHSA